MADSINNMYGLFPAKVRPAHYSYRVKLRRRS